MFIFVDESERPGRYVVAATYVGVRDAATVRRRLADLVLPGQRRLHFKSESDRRRRAILRAVSDLPAAIDVYVVRGERSTPARIRALRAIVADAQGANEDHVVFIERVDGLEEADQRTISSARASAPSLTSQHLSPTEDPVLWVSDAAAWAVGAGGAWPGRLGTTLRSVIELGS